MNRLLQFTLLIAIIVATTGCITAGHARAFDVIAHNSGTEGLDKIRIEFPTFFDSFGILSPGITASHSLFEGKWPAEAKVIWRFDGERPYMPDRIATVAVPAYPDRERGESVELWFELDGKTVTALAKVRRPISWRKP